MVYSKALGKLIREKTYSRKSRVRLPLTTAERSVVRYLFSLLTDQIDLIVEPS
jgi:hypothetical protein